MDNIYRKLTNVDDNSTVEYLINGLVLSTHSFKAGSVGFLYT